jgi:hypothetical protein
MLHDLPPPVSPEAPAITAGIADCDSYDYNDNEVDPTDQLQGEYWTSFDHYQFSLLIPTAEIGYAPPYARFPYTHLQTVIDSGKGFEADFEGTGQVDNMRAYF